jgi:hypothetical protein
MKKWIIIAIFIVILSYVIMIYMLNNNKNKIGNNEENKLDTDQNKVMILEDKELEKIIRVQISKPEGDILFSDMQLINSININYKTNPVSNISGLEYAYNLRDFSYRYGTLKSLNPIRNCTKLFYLSISYAVITESTQSFNTPSLERVSFIDTNVSDYEFLKDTISIKDLCVDACGVTSLSFVSKMKDLEELEADNNRIIDISPLKNKNILKMLNLHQNEVVDLNELSTCKQLEEINISYNHITNLNPLSTLSKLIIITAYEDLDKKIIDRGQIQEFINKGVEVKYHK